MTFIKLPFVIKIFVLSIFEWPFFTGFTVYVHLDVILLEDQADQPRNSAWLPRFLSSVVLLVQDRVVSWLARCGCDTLAFDQTGFLSSLVSIYAICASRSFEVQLILVVKIHMGPGFSLC